MRVGGVCGQAAMEYLLAAGFAFLLLLPIFIIAYTQSDRFTSDVTGAQLEKIGNEIIDAANSVSYAGPPSKKTFQLYFPERVRDVEINGSRLVFTVESTGGPYEYALYAQTNMSGQLRSFAGIHTVTVEAIGGFNSYVNVTD